MEKFFKKHRATAEVTSWAGCAVMWFGLAALGDVVLRHYALRPSLVLGMLALFGVAPLIVYVLTAAMAVYYGEKKPPNAQQ